MIVAELPPVPEIARPAPRAEAAYGIAVFGDRSLLAGLQAAVEERGWTTRWLMVGEDNLSLLILVLPSTPPQDVTTLMNAINEKRFGNLTAGLARIGGD